MNKPNSLNTKRATVICAAVVAIAALNACNKAAGSHSAKATSVATASTQDAREIAVTEEQEKQLDVGKIPSTVVTDTIKVSGRVEADETRQARVGTPIAGRIAELMVREGDSVQKGQVLAALSSTDLTNAQFAFLRAYSQMQLSQRAVERAQQLLDAGVIGTAELQRRQAELAQNKAEVAAARGQLKVLGMAADAADALETTNTVNSLSQIVASIDGIVLERKATIGQIVQPADTIFLIAELSSVWMVADVPEQTAGNLLEGAYAEAEVSSLPGSTVRGRLTHVHSVLNPDTRTVRVHMDVANTQRKLKPGMLATMTLKQNPRREMVLPLTAIVRENDREFVFVKREPRHFALQEVSISGEYEDRRILAGGLDSGDVVVLNGAFHLNNERKRLAQQGQRPQGE
jgi:cobalt-zinc-cadmium efflux system membrane fusion protein